MEGRKRLRPHPDADGQRCDHCIPLLYRAYERYSTEQSHDGQHHLHQSDGCDRTTGPVSAPAGRFCSGGCALGRGKQSYRCGCAACIGTKPCGLGRGSDRRYASTCIAERSMADCGRWQKGIHRLFPGKFYQHTGKAGSAGGRTPYREA